MRSLQQVNQEIQARTEACMDEKKNNQGGFFTLWGNREENRGKCESYARMDLADELRAAEEAEAAVTNAINSATIRNASTAGTGLNSNLLIGAGIALIALYLLFS